MSTAPAWTQPHARCGRCSQEGRGGAAEPFSPEPLGMHLGSLAACLPCSVYCWWLLREKHLLCSVSETPGMQRRWSSWADEHAKEELGLRASPRGVTPVETGTCLRNLLNKCLQSSVLVGCDRPSHKQHSLHGILSAAGLQFWNFFPLSHLRELHHRKCKFSGNFTVLDFATSAEQAAAKQIIPSSHICDFVLAWHEFGHDVCLWAGFFRCWWGQRCWEGVEEEKNDDRDLQLLVNQSHLQGRPIATGNC